MVHQQSIEPFSLRKMTFRSGPFSELENAYPSEISNHFPNWKGTSHPGPFFELEK
jgi:hypothetical protein